MISPIRFLWKQFNGPQITAICQAIFEYFRETFDVNLDYLRNLSISTASSDHLTLIGITQGIARPLIPLPDEDMFVFTQTYAYLEDTENPGHLVPEPGYRDTANGLGIVGDNVRGGKLDWVKAKGNYNYISDNIFRAVLRGAAETKGKLGGLIALDDILSSIWKNEHPHHSPIHTIEIAQTTDSSQLIGDIVVDMGVDGDWVNPYEIAAQIRLLGQTLYYPEPRLRVKLGQGDGTIEVFGFVRILVKTDEEEGVWGLDAMWEGTGTPTDICPPLDEEPEFAVLPISESELQLMWTYDDNTWIDEDAPTDEFQALTVDNLNKMW